MTLTLEIPTQADYHLLLQLLQKFEGVRIATPQKADSVAEESEVYQTPPKKVRDMEKYIGCLTYPATDEETVAKLQSIRAEWDRDFF
jgi:hypothetical protein